MGTKNTKTMISIGAIAILMTNSLVAKTTQRGFDNQGYIDSSRELAGMGGTFGTGVKGVKDNKGTIQDDWLDSVIYTDTVERVTMMRPYETVISVGDTGTLALRDVESEVVALNKEGQPPEDKTTKSTEPPRYFVGGFCSVVTPAEVSKSNAFTTLSCILDFGNGTYRQAEVFTGLYPDYKRETLIGLPIYASLEGGTKAQFDGVVLDDNKGSLNIADKVDTKRIQKLVAESALVLNDTAYKYSTAYLNQVQASKIKNEVSYINTGVGVNQAVTPINTQKIIPPNPYDFFASAGVELVSQLFSVVGKDYLYGTTPLFTMAKGKRVYVEGVLTLDNKGLSKQFGVMKEAKAKEATKSSSEWITERDNRISKYGQIQKQSTQQSGGIGMQITRTQTR